MHVFKVSDRPVILTLNVDMRDLRKSKLIVLAEQIDVLMNNDIYAYYW